MLSFPVGIDELKKAAPAELIALGVRYEDHLVKNAVRRRIKYKATGWIEYDEFYPRLSKSIADDIDLALAGHYGFTADEVDFVINYDIKYRLGREADGDDDE